MDWLLAIGIALVVFVPLWAVSELFLAWHKNYWKKKHMNSREAGLLSTEWSALELIPAIRRYRKDCNKPRALFPLNDLRKFGETYVGFYRASPQLIEDLQKSLPGILAKRPDASTVQVLKAVKAFAENKPVEIPERDLMDLEALRAVAQAVAMQPLFPEDGPERFLEKVSDMTSYDVSMSVVGLGVFGLFDDVHRRQFVLATLEAVRLKSVEIPEEVHKKLVDYSIDNIVSEYQND